MKQFFSLIGQQARHYRQLDFLTFAVLTLLAVLSGQTTVFYLIYFFWWNELVRIVMDRIYYKRNTNAVLVADENEKGRSVDFLGGLFLMGIYWVFIVVFFGFIAGWGNSEITTTNMRVLFFQNWFFNGNVIFVLFERLYLHKTQQPLKIYFGVFNPNAIVLHLSIIIGGVLMFFVVKGYPELFTPENRWGSVVIVLPFLLLRMLVNYMTVSIPKIRTD